MRRSLMYVLLAAGSLVTGGGSALCFAADATSAGVTAPRTAPVQPSQREMHRMQQTNSEEQRAGDAAEDQSTGDDHAKGGDQQQNEDQNESKDQPQAEAAADNSSSFVAPIPSQRAMRQQIRDARQNQAPAAGNQ